MFAIWENTKDLFIPKTCPGCGMPLHGKLQAVCEPCLASFIRASRQRISKEFAQSFAGDGYISTYFGLFLFKDDMPISKTIHAFKYGQKYKLAYEMGRMAGKKLETTAFVDGIDLILPLPLHPLKYAERGYNQSAFLAKGLQDILHIEFRDKALKRVRNTPSQTGLNAVERRENVRNAFRAANRKLIAGRTILLVDDVKTTGATLNECARVLSEAGAREIRAVTLAIAD